MKERSGNRQNRFLKLFGGRYALKKSDAREVNSWLWCAAYALVGLAFAVFFCWDICSLAGDELREESFVLLYAEDYHNSMGRGLVNELRMYGCEIEKFIAKDGFITPVEIDRFVELAAQGDEIRVLTGKKTGVRQIFRGGECFLSLEDSTRRMNWKIALNGVGVALFGGLAAVFALRAAALLIGRRENVR